MSNKTYVRLNSGGVVAEPAISLPAAVPISSIFGTAATFVDVTALSSVPSVGETVSVIGTTVTVTAAALSTGSAPVPAQVSSYQIKVVLQATAGSGGTLYDNVATWVATQPEATQLMWSGAPYFARGGAFFAAAAAHFSWASATIDGWFTAAAAGALTA